MKRLWLTAGLLAAAFSMGLQAQVLDARAEVPFDFWLGQQLIPAGGYSIYHFGTGAVLLKGDGNMTTVMFLGQRIARPEVHADGKLVFTRYGDTYFLSKIWTPFQRDGYGVPKSAREKEIASRSIPAKSTDVAVATK